MFGQHLYFEGVCETHAILTPGVCGSGAPTALDDTTSPGPAGPAESECEFQEAHVCCIYINNLVHWIVFAIAKGATLSS